ncbi:MAG: biotin-independent malonate decarboxylase subunit beta [Burkholderiales bacterium]|nr:biotin-independent malonate decarboxylase subunit beta [Burkholderiales bacterium]
MIPARRSFLEASARGRIRSMLDPDSFSEICGPGARRTSPHLQGFGMPVAFDDGVVTGEGLIAGHRVLIAAQEGGFMGGAIGEVHGAKITGLIERAIETRPAAVILLLDSGGVRLQEANAGLLAMGEIHRVLLDARSTGLPILGAIGGRNGCYGGTSIIARCCDCLIASEEGRLSISGPEVIETVEGIEEFDAQDRALVWRTMGAKHRRLIDEIDVIVPDDMSAFRNAIIAQLNVSRPLSLETLEAEQSALRRRVERFRDAADARDIWRALGVDSPECVSEMEADDFNRLVEGLEGSGS